jgi:hypothetical protein
MLPIRGSSHRVLRWQFFADRVAGHGESRRAAEACQDERCVSLEVLPAESPMPQKGCYRTTPSARGGIVTRRSQEEYPAVGRAR